MSLSAVPWRAEFDSPPLNTVPFRATEILAKGTLYLAAVSKNPRISKEKAVSKHLKEATNSAKRFPRLTLTTVLVATVILTIAAATVVSRQRARATEASAAEKSTQVAKESKGESQGNFRTVKVAGQDVQVNSQTGEIKALTQEEARKLAAGLKQMINQSTEGLVQVQHDDGSVSMDLEGRFQNVTVARVNKDGSVSQSCVDNPQAAGAFFGIDPKLIENEANAGAIRSQSRRKAMRKQQ